MAENWPWESLRGSISPSAAAAAAAASTSSTQQHMSTSPLQSSSSQSSHEAGGAVVAERQGPRGEAATRPTLVEALRTCLTSAAMTPPAARSLNDPGPPPATLRSGGAASGSASRPSTRRRSRASSRVPTTVVETTSSDFKQTVHRLTGIATPAPAPVRPQAKRPTPSPHILPTSAPHLQLLNSILNIPATTAPPPVQPAIWQPRQQSHDEEIDPFIKSEAGLVGTDSGIGASSQSPYGMTMPQSLSTPTSSIQTWWDAGAPAQSQSFATNPIATIPFDSSIASSEHILQEDLDAWFSPDHPDSDYMR